MPRKRSIPDNRLPLPPRLYLRPSLPSELRAMLRAGMKCPDYPQGTREFNRLQRHFWREAKRDQADHQRMVEEARRKRVNAHLRANAATCKPYGGWNQRYLSGMHTNISTRCA